MTSRLHLAFDFTAAVIVWAAGCRNVLHGSMALGVFEMATAMRLMHRSLRTILDQYCCK